MPDHKTPGVYIEEVPKFPPSITSVETAIPAFIGYTEKAQLKEPGDLKNKPWRITSMVDYEKHFGYPDPEKEIEVTFDKSGSSVIAHAKVNTGSKSNYLMHYSLQLFFSNGGGPCWIISVGDYTGTSVIMDSHLKDGLNEIKNIDEITLILFPDAINLVNGDQYYALYKEAIDQCETLQDRFTLMDVFQDAENTTGWQADIDFLRNTLTGNAGQLKYAAAYFPRIYTIINFHTENSLVKIVSGGAGDLPATLAELKSTNITYYNMAINAINNMEMLLPVTPAVAGVYAQVDNTRGVWKAPANVNINYAIRPEYQLTNNEQENLNVDTVTGKSINVIRAFSGRGPAIIWGARTLAGNDNEWRYISVRRYFNMVEESIKNATQQFGFEPNEHNTWIRIKSMIENYLTQQWRSGALMGAKTEEAFFVHIGVGETMTALDIYEGRMIVEIGMAVVSPAEFIIIRLMQKMSAGS